MEMVGKARLALCAAAVAASCGARQSLPAESATPLPAGHHAEYCPTYVPTQAITVSF